MNWFNFIATLGVSLILVGTAYTADSCVCTQEFKEVCGSDGVTYSNICKLNCAAEKNKCITKFSDKACNGDCVCPAYLQYICGTDGVSYQNECQMKCAARKQQKPCLKKARDGEC